MSGQSPLIFVSYAHGDLDFVSRLAHDLQRVGVTIWQDKKDIRVGVDWSREAERGIKNCTSVLVVLSSKSVESDHVRAELLYAREKQKHIIPVLYEKCTLPLLLVGLQYVDLTGHNYYQGVLRIADSARKPITNINTLASVQLVGGEKTERRNFHLSWKLSLRRFSASFSVALMGILAIYFVMSQIEKRPIEIPAEPPASIPERTEPPAQIPERAESPASIPERAEPPAPIAKRAQPPAPMKAERSEPTAKEVGRDEPPRVPAESSRIRANTTKEIARYLSLARQYHERGAYDEALSELNAAHKLDSTSDEVVAEIERTKRACNAEKTLGRTDLKC